MSSEPDAQPRPKRSATESLLSIALGLDAVLVFFVMMTAFGLDLLPPGAVFGGGIALMAVLVLAGRLVKHPWGVWLGHALQLALIALGFILPAMFFIGALFAALWIFCFISGQRLDRRNAALLNPSPIQQSTPH